MEVPFEVTFAPTDLCQDLRYDGLTCTIEGTSPLYLTLTGSCIMPPTAKEVGVNAHHLGRVTLTSGKQLIFLLCAMVRKQSELVA